ncbi:GlxA family transcriptional regulator [soil metagenome]
MSQRPKLRVGFLLMHNFTLTAFANFVDVLRLAGDESDRSRPILCAWHVMSPSGRATRSSCGIAVQPTADLIDPKSLDYVVVVGGLLQGTPPLPLELEAYLRGAAEGGARLVGVCTGSFVLCRLGLLKNRKCCVSWFHYRDFLDEFPQLVPVADRLFVIDSNRITCSGGTGVADLAAYLVSRHLGLAAAQKALRIMCIEHPRTEWSAQPLADTRSGGDDFRVSRALLHMEQNLADPLPIAAIADRLGISIRQLERAFRAHMQLSPHKAYVALRLRHARWMLENTRDTSTRLAQALGFADASHFVRCFRRQFGTTPEKFRHQVRQLPARMNSDAISLGEPTP